MSIKTALFVFAAVLAGVFVASVGTAHAADLTGQYGQQILSVGDLNSGNEALAENEEYTASDPVTVIEVTKLSSAAGNAGISGAVMQIVEASSGRVVYRWTTNGNTITINRSLYYPPEYEDTAHRVNLNLNTVYLLQEVSAPLGYVKAPDVRFEITGIYDSTVTLLEYDPDHVDFDGEHHIFFYDDSTTQPREPVGLSNHNHVVHRDREEQKQDEQTQTQSQTQKPNGNLSQTGDEGTLYLAAAVISAAGLCFIAIGIHRLRRQI